MLEFDELQPLANREATPLLKNCVVQKKFFRRSSILLLKLFRPFMILPSMWWPSLTSILRYVLWTVCGSSKRDFAIDTKDWPCFLLSMMLLAWRSVTERFSRVTIRTRFFHSLGGWGGFSNCCFKRRSYSSSRSQGSTCWNNTSSGSSCDSRRVFTIDLSLNLKINRTQP